MPRVKTLAEFSAKAGLYANAGIREDRRRAVESAALFATQSARASIRAGSGDGRLSQVGRSGARVGARYDIQGVKNPTALVRATGPLHLMDNPTRPHRITAKVRKGRSRRSRSNFYNAIFGGGTGFAGATPLRTPYGPRFSVEHPGTRGKRTFWRGIDVARPLLPRKFSEGYRQGLRKFWAG